MAMAAERAVRAHADQETKRRLESFRSQLPRGQAVEGLAATLAALRDGQVSDVFIADDPESDAVAWIGPGAADLAATEAELRERGTGQVTRDRADAAIIRAAAATGAELHLVPDDEPPPREGVGALLRYPAPAG